MGGTHGNTESAHPSSPILIFKSALRFPKEASMGGTHRHSDSARPSSPILIFKKCTAFFQGGIDGWHTSPQR